MGLLAETLHGKNSTINVDAVKGIRRSRHLENGDQMDQAYVLKVQLSKQLPPERVNAIINVILMVRRNATDDEIENTLVSWRDCKHIFAWLDFTNSHFY